MSKKSFEFLSQVHSLPNMDISKVNQTLYMHVEELAKIRDYRLMVILLL